MSPIQAPVCAHNTRIRADVALSRTELLHINTLFRHGSFLDEENSMTTKRVESVAKYKLPTYQAAAVVSTVLAGVESQLLVFFKTSPNITQQSAPVMLQYLLVLTYIALIFSVSATISSLVLTKNFGNVPMLSARFQKRVKRHLITSRFGTATFQTRFSSDIAPRRWRWIEWHWLFTLVLSVLCLQAQIFLYIWMQERGGIRATVSVAGVFSMLPLLHFLPFRRERVRDQVELGFSPFPDAAHWESSPGTTVLPAHISSLPVVHTARPASQVGY
ncbi:hypothetical protein BJV78DRAFT_418339 [Lactifluus subvellereus]|nr:hypothetical protein BJV78DRAFT_418339 [Lactifluus subvellereus]